MWFSGNVDIEKVPWTIVEMPTETIAHFRLIPPQHHAVRGKTVEFLPRNNVPAGTGKSGSYKNFLQSVPIQVSSLNPPFKSLGLSVF